MEAPQSARKEARRGQVAIGYLVLGRVIWPPSFRCPEGFGEAPGPSWVNATLGTSAFTRKREMVPLPPEPAVED